jgi:hypothetical protein
MHVSLPPNTQASQLRTFADGRRVPHRITGRIVSFSLRTARGRPANWAVAG